MARKDPRDVPIRQFLGKHVDRMEQAHEAQQRERFPQLIALYELLHEEWRPSPPGTSGPEWDELARWWPMRVLRQAAKEEDSEGCKRLLYFFLLELDIRLPKGVLVPFRWSRGRRDETEAIYDAWVEKERPPITGRLCDELAKKFYPEEFRKADSSARKRVRDRIRATIHRHVIRKTLVP